MGHLTVGMRARRGLATTAPQLARTALAHPLHAAHVFLLLGSGTRSGCDRLAACHNRPCTRRSFFLPHRLRLARHLTAYLRGAL